MLGEILFEKYKIEELLNEEPIWQLYRGVDIETRQTVIATVIRSTLISADEFLAQFRAVPERLKGLDTPYAVLVEYCGENYGQAVVVQSNVTGQTLAEILADSDGLPVNFVLDIMQQIGEFLEILHRAGQVHGDINPASVILGSDGVVRVANPGVASALNLGDLISSGSVEAQAYHAPELRAGEVGTATTDFFSLGATIYETLTGAALDLDPPDSSPSRLRLGIPPELDALVVDCLQADPARRIKTAAELLHGIEEVHQGMGVGAQETILGIEDALVGHTLGAYQLVERLGQGGMATVYKAFEPALDRYVAIKVLPQFFARDPNFMQRFRREAKAIAQLNHPNIVPIHSYGEESGITYIAMRYVEEGALMQMRGEMLQPERAIRLILPVAKALAYAHKQGILHRDIKPGNVLLSEGDWPLLTDFGLAKMVESSTQLTKTGVGVGTPMYMSPEQGQGAEVDQRTDIYSLGIMLYELVTGDVPFRAGTPMAIVIKHITAPIPPPRAINPQIPESLERIILKATSKSPDNRYRDADEMAAALEEVLMKIPGPVSEGGSTTPEFADLLESRLQPDSVDTPSAPAIASVQVNLDFLRQNWRKIALIFIPIIVLACIGGLLLFRWLFTGSQTSPGVVGGVTETSIPEAIVIPTIVQPTDTQTAIPSPTLTDVPTQTTEPTQAPTQAVAYLGGGRGQLAYASDRGGDVQIYLQNIEGDSAIQQLTDLPGGACQPAWSPDGMQLVFISPCSEQDESYPDASLYLMDVESGQWQKIASSGVGQYDPIWSPDGSRIAYTALDGSHFHIHILTLADRTDRSISNRLSNEMQPSWSPDGELIVFLSTSSGRNLLFTMTANGESAVQFTRDIEKTNLYPRWSPDGNTILYMQLNNIGYPVLVSGLYEKQGYSEDLVTTEYTAPMRDPAYSPDGLWLAFSSNYDGSNHDIWIMTAAGTNPKPLATHPAFDFDPAWRP